nr:hypothetical protein BaRGS_021661 [Batillaria attramentaria]
MYDGHRRLSKDKMTSTVYCDCHPTHELLGGSCLEIVHDASVNFSDAKKACDHKFGRLAVLDSAALESVLNILPLPYKFWIDITRRTDDCGSIEEWSGVYGYLDVPCMINDRGYICQYGKG